MNSNFQVAVIGMGPAGACVSSLLRNQGISVVSFERQSFPRFSIGESLLPRCMEDLKTAGFIDVIEGANFQYKDGALFFKGDSQVEFSFAESFSEGRKDAFEVERAKFDKVLADSCEKKGVKIKYEHQVQSIETQENEKVQLKVLDLKSDQELDYHVDFVVDASGYGRVLPRLLNLQSPPSGEPRSSIFCHLKSGLKQDPSKIGIIVSEKNPDIWFWVIPFKDGSVSVGVVSPTGFLDDFNLSTEELYIKLLTESRELQNCLEFPVSLKVEAKRIDGYASSVKSLHGPNFVLLGNAGEFIDPIFSSGVTIACRSACLAAPLIGKQLSGQAVDWNKEFTDEFLPGVEVFRNFINSWYRGELMDIFLGNAQKSKIKNMICSVLAGYVWDQKNPFVKNSERSLKALTEWVRN